MDEQKLNELIYEIRQLIRTLGETGKQPGQARDTADLAKPLTNLDRSNERLIRALARLSTEVQGQSRTEADREKSMRRFVDAVDQSTDAAEKETRAAQERAAADAAAAAAAEELARIQAELAARLTWTQQQREDHDARMQAEQAKAQKAENEARLAKSNSDLANQIRRDRYQTSSSREVFEAASNLGSPMDRMRDGFLDLAGNNMKLQAGLQGLMAVTSGLTNSMIAYGKAVYRGEQGAAVASKSLMNLTESVGTFMQVLGGIMAFIPGFNLLGIGIGLAGTGLKKFGEAANEASEMSDRLYKSYGELSKSGLSASDGMIGLGEDARRLGFGLDESGVQQFTELLGRSSRDLALFGGSAIRGRKAFVDFAEDITRGQVGRELMNLGMSVPEINEGLMSYVALQTQVGMTQGRTQDQLRAGATAYLREMDGLAKLTGVQRKDLEDSIKKARAVQQFRARTAALRAQGPEGEKAAQQMENFYKVLASQDVDLAQGFAEQAGGMIVSKAGESFAHTVGFATDVTEKLASGQMQATDAFQAVADQSKVFVEQNQSLGLAGAVTYGNFIGAANMAAFSGRNMAEVMAEIQAEGDKQAAGAEGVVGTQTDLRISQMQLRDAQQDLIFRGIKPATSAAETFSSTLSGAANKIREILGMEPLPGTPAAAAAGPAAPSAITTTQGAQVFQGGIMGGLERFMTGGQGFRSYSAGPAPGAAPTAPGAAPTAPGAAPAGPGGAPASQTPPPPQGQPPAEVPGNQPVSGLPPGKALSDILEFTAPSGTQQAFMSLDPALRERVIKAALDYNDSTGGRFTINSAKRSPQDQERLYQESVQAGRPGRGPTGMPIARPGTSPHEKGLAVDIQQYNDPMALSALNRAGLYNRIGGDPVHFHMARGGIARGPDSGYPATLHGIEAVVPLPNGRSIPVDFDRQFQEQVRQIVQDNAAGSVNFAEIARRSDTNQRALDRVTSTIIPEIRAMMRETTDSAGPTPTTATATTDTAAIDRIATRLTQELARSINNIMSQQTGAATQQSNLLERMVDLQNRNVTVAERLLRVSQG